MSLEPFKMPQLGLGDGEVEVREWLLEAGAEFDVGAPLLEVETDKAVMEVEAPSAGVLVEQVCAVGDMVAPGTVIAYLAPPGTAIEDARAELAAIAEQPAAESPTTEAVSAAPAAQPYSDLEAPRDDGGGPTFVSVASGALAGIPIPAAAAQPQAAVSAAPRIDVEELDDRDAAGPATEQRLSRRRRAIAKRTLAAVSVPTFTVTREIEGTRLREAVAAYRESGTRATVTDLFLRACGIAGKQNPAANAWLLDETLLEFEYVNVSLAVDAADGVVAPVVRSVDTLDVEEIAKQRAGLVERAREGRSGGEELTGGTMTLSNVAGLGAHGIRPVLAVPQVMALGVGMARARGDREVLDVCLVGDHRALDGADGARYLASFADAIEALVAAVTD